MPYKYLEHGADVGIEATGDTIEEAFSSGAEALLNTAFEIESIEAIKEVSIRAKAPSLDLLFIEFLNELISLLDLEELAVREVQTEEISELASGVWSFKGAALGETFDPEKHRVKTEVKAATYSGLSYELKDGLHTLRCVIDV